MPTATQNKVKKTKSSSKDMLAFFDSHGTASEETPKPKKEVKVSSKKNTKQEAVTEEKEVPGEKSSIQEVEIPTAKKNDKAEAVKKIQTSSIAASDTSKTEKKTSALGSFFGKEDNQEKKKEVKEEDSESTKKKEEKSTKPSLFGRLFGSRSKTKEQEVSEAKNRSAEKVIISEPVKATPIPQRKLANQSKLSTFGLSKERDQFIENLSMLVLSGMSIVSAISSIIKQTKSSGMKLILERMLAEIEAGSTIWKAFDRTEFFKGYTISLIRLGEESGNFAENLKVVALEEEKDREFKSKVRSALMYPIFVLGLTAIIGIGISWFILPKLSKIFYDLKLTLPFITKVLLAFGVFLSKHGIVVVPLAAVVIFGIGYIVFIYKKTKFIGEYIIFAIPGVKMLLMEVEVARFGYLLGTLLEAGLPVTKAIDSLASATEVIRYKKFYLALRESIDMGNSFEKSFALYKNIDKIIPPPIQQLIVSGEQSGNLNKTLIKVGQVLEAKSDTTTKNLTIIMEPILLVIVWAGVVTVAFAVILPIYSLVGGLNNIK